MEFSSGFFGGLLTGSGSWKIKLSEAELVYYKDGKIFRRVLYVDIIDIKHNKGVVWADVFVKCHDNSFKLDGIENADGKKLFDFLFAKVTSALFSQVEPHQQRMQQILSSLDSLFCIDKYLSHFDIIEFIKKQASDVDSHSRSVMNALSNPLFPAARMPESTRAGISNLIDIIQGNSKAVAQRNEKFISDELAKYKAFFDTVEKQPITDEQRRASVVMEDRNLLIAAAGSGKTSTVVAKVGYAILRGYALPDQILALAFNEKAAQELAERLTSRLGAILKGKTIKAKTFHSLGMEIIAETEGTKPSVAEYAAGSSGSGQKLIAELIDELTSTDVLFAAELSFFRAIYLKPSPDPADFKSIEEWNQHVKETGDYESGKGNGYKTFNGELVKSQGELAIANWLFMNGVSYEYERDYQYQTADKQFRQYKPDFYFPQIDCYLEHYALNKQGKPPPAFGKKYLASMEWKRALHDSKGTAYFETYFHEFADGTLFKKLENELTARGIVLKPIDHRQILAKVNELQRLQSNEFFGLIRTFMKHVKANQLTVAELRSSANNRSSGARELMFLRLIERLMEAYSNWLQRHNCIDFEDMIIKAASYAGDGKFQHNYKLILVDEFQDISRDRAGLLSGLLKADPAIKMFAVGDDWQSIYRFAGSDISLFTGFSKYFGVTSTNYLTTTFRSNQGIADTAAAFVQANGSQIKKSIVSVDRDFKNVISVLRFGSKDEVNDCIEQCLKEIALIPLRSSAPHHVMLLGRYNHVAPSNIERWQRIYRNKLIMEFSTIHKAKGREADYVILLGLQADKSGFPSTIADDPLLALVMPEPELFPHAEERRLLYVAITRAKHGVYLLSSRFSPSAFMKELEKLPESSEIFRFVETENQQISSAGSELCPRCHRGRLRKINGKNGPFLGCSHYPTCNFTRNDGESSRPATTSSRYHTRRRR